MKHLLSHTGVRATLALLVTGTFCGLAVAGKIPPGLEGITGMVLGFFFKARPEKGAPDA